MEAVRTSLLKADGDNGLRVAHPLGYKDGFSTKTYICINVYCNHTIDVYHVCANIGVDIINYNCID